MCIFFLYFFCKKQNVNKILEFYYYYYYLVKIKIFVNKEFRKAHKNMPTNSKIKVPL